MHESVREQTLMFISIVIPTYNRAHLISRAIKSVIGQTYPSWELIIVDDGSTDNTYEIIKPFLSDARMQYHKKINSGAAHSRNVGVEISKGEWITFLDSDDEAYPNWLDEFAKMIDAKKSKVCCCGLIKVGLGDKVMEQIMPHKMGPILNSKIGRFTNGGVYIILKSIFLAVGGFDNDLKSGQHTEFAYRLMPYLDSHGVEIDNIFEPLIKIHIHGGERIRSNFRAKIEGVQYVLHKHKFLFDKHPITKSTYQTNLAYYYRKNGQFSKAFRYYIKAFQTYPSLKKFFRILVFFK
jgi:glycosyltransferase involved in cell wall biosynthesis